VWRVLDEDRGRGVFRYDALMHEFTETLCAPRERVLRAFTDEAELQRWFAEPVHVEPQPGGEYRF
jgi:uncharacterized protein YndB with AHSA1/START domain